MKKTAAVAELKAQLSRYLSRVKSGEEILITERGCPVARLVPVRSIEQADSGLQDLERQGLVRLGTGKLDRAFWKLPRPQDRGGSIRKAVDEERKSGW
jgi:prevent-host-death family protein